MKKGKEKKMSERRQSIAKERKKNPTERKKKDGKKTSVHLWPSKIKSRGGSE